MIRAYTDYQSLPVKYSLWSKWINPNLKTIESVMPNECIIVDFCFFHDYNTNLFMSNTNY